VGNRRARGLRLRQAEEADWARVRTEPRPAHCDVHARGIGVRRLQLIVAATFEEVVVWEVRQGQEWQLIRPRVFATEPKLMLVGHDVVPFSSSALAAYFERLVGLTLPLRPDRMGLVGPMARCMNSRCSGICPPRGGSSGGRRGRSSGGRWWNWLRRSTPRSRQPDAQTPTNPLQQTAAPLSVSQSLSVSRPPRLSLSVRTNSGPCCR
jgi:hypothetical protein